MNEISVLLKHLQDQNGSAFDPKEYLANTTANIAVSVLLNTRHTWGTEELEKVITMTETFNAGFTDVFVLGFIKQYLPLFLVKACFGARIKACRAKTGILRHYIRETIAEHRKSLDKTNIRDFIDVFLSEGKDKEVSEYSFVNTIAAFFPDAVSSTTDVMNWAFIHLAYQPENQKKAQEQLDEVIL